MEMVAIPPSPQDFITEPQLGWGFLFGADGTSSLGPDAENKKQGRPKPPGSVMKS